MWIHACSVGEVRSSYNIIESFIKDGYKVLVTSNTYLSSLDVENKSDKVSFELSDLKRFLI